MSLTGENAILLMWAQLAVGRLVLSSPFSEADKNDRAAPGDNLYPAIPESPPVAGFKTISDTVHGTVRLEGIVLDLLETLEIQRLNSIRQLGLTYLVFPGANHSRIEHVVGVSHVAGQMADALGLSHEEKDTVMAAGILHDVGHGPFSHTLEHVLSYESSLDHMKLTQKIITGDEDNVDPSERREFPEVPRIPEVIEKHGLRPADIAALVRGVPMTQGLRGIGEPSPARSRKKRYLAQIIHSTVDADQVDYLMRDAHYTGVAHGAFDYRRLLQTMELRDGKMVIDKKGLPALEGMLVARALMYSSVYFHKTVRIAEQMVARAVERSSKSIAQVQKMVDAELINWLVEQGGLQREFALRIKYRRLFKRAWHKGRDDLSKEQCDALLQLADRDKRRKAEDAICRRAGIEEGRVLIDVPAPELLLSEPRITAVDIDIVDDERSVPFRKSSPLSRALQLREVSDWVVMVAADQRYLKEVRAATDRVLFS